VSSEPLDRAALAITGECFPEHYNPWAEPCLSELSRARDVIVQTLNVAEIASIIDAAKLLNQDSLETAGTIFKFYVRFPERFDYYNEP